MNSFNGVNSIHGIQNYIDFDYELNPYILIPFLPLIYIIPTMFVMWKVFKGYQTQPLNLAKMTFDGHLFFLLMLYFIIRVLVMKWCIFPILFLVPLVCVSFMIPSMGYCRQLGRPFPFGSIDIYYTRGFLGLRRSYFILALSFICWICSAALSSVMYFKLRTGIMHNASSYTRKLAKRAEFSISITLISAIVPFITNTIVSITTLWTPDIMFYFILLRLIGNDFETVMMPWILYVTHPIFREKREKKTKKTNCVLKISHRTTI
uniref:Serpentine Receptor, class U n=1 Tax=Caenorhabditis tropicalis TaxID=1561998 RepID=A0A1I7U9G2_9PELO